MKTMKKSLLGLQSPFFLLLYFCWIIISLTDLKAAAAAALNEEDVPPVEVPLVRKDQRKQIVSTEYGEITAVDIHDGVRGSYHLQFITLEPNSLFLPVLLHADMVLYVHTGGGRLSWTTEDEIRRVNLKQGDVYRLRPGTVFFVQSNLEQERQKLRIYSIFAASANDLHEPSIGAYSSLRDLVLGFDKRVLQAAFKVPDELVEELMSAPKPPGIVHGVPKKGLTFWELEAQFMKGILGSKGYSMFDVDNKREKTKTFNVRKAKPDFENCNGWSLTVTKKELNALRGSNIGLFMVNLTKGSMMGPHWNPTATEVSIVLQGQGMIRVVCSSTLKESDCKNMRFRVEEGDVFTVPRFHPMSQMSFNNGSFVFMGFSTTTKKNHPQFLAGKSSVLQTLDKQVLAASFNVPNATIDQLLAPQGESIILECTSCAEEEEMIMEEELEKEREEAREREEEEARKREEERRREEEEARKREEEEARRREEEKRREEEARQREAEEARRREEEEEARQREAEEARRREEEEEARRREEEARQREAEEARRREEEAARQRQAEEAQRKEEEAEEAQRREEEETRQREAEEARRREEEAARQKQAEEAQRREEAEEARRREEEKTRQREAEEAHRREEEAEEETRRQEEEARRREEEGGGGEERPGGGEEEQRQQEAERQRQEAAAREEEAARRQEEEMEREQGGGDGGGRGQQEREGEEIKEAFAMRGEQEEDIGNWEALEGHEKQRQEGAKGSSNGHGEGMARVPLKKMRKV